MNWSSKIWIFELFCHMDWTLFKTKKVIKEATHAKNNLIHGNPKRKESKTEFYQRKQEYKEKHQQNSITPTPWCRTKLNGGVTLIKIKQKRKETKARYTSSVYATELTPWPNFLELTLHALNGKVKEKDMHHQQRKAMSHPQRPAVSSPTVSIVSQDINKLAKGVYPQKRISQVISMGRKGKNK